MNEGEGEPKTPVPTGCHRPRLLRYGMLGVFWVFPSAGAICILVAGQEVWLVAEGVFELAGRIPVEQWVALVLLGIHAFWLAGAWYCARKEIPRPEPDSDSDGVKGSGGTTNEHQ